MLGVFLSTTTSHKRSLQGESEEHSTVGTIMKWEQKRSDTAESVFDRELGAKLESPRPAMKKTNATTGPEKQVHQLQCMKCWDNTIRISTPSDSSTRINTLTTRVSAHPK